MQTFVTSKDVASIGEAHVKLMLEALRDRAPPADHERLWGPIVRAISDECGAPAAAASALIRPTKIAQGIVESVFALLPDALTPNMADTPASLARRLAACDFLDPIRTQAKGNGKGGLVLLNKTTYPQARRKCWSVIAGKDASLPFAVGLDQEVVGLLCYERSSVVDYYCSPMPPPVFALGVELWKTAWPYLTEVCQRQPTNHCELLCYYTLFNGRMGRHRDNYKTGDLREYLLTGADPRLDFRGVQVANSNVLIWSMGNAPMTMSLSFAPKDNRSVGRGSYIVHPTFQFELEGGTLFIFQPLDDLFFCHETEFEQLVLEELGAAGHRFAIVYRWLEEQCVQQFDVRTGAKYESTEMKASREVKARVATAAKALKRRRDVGL
jgi:hypothetical protein